MDAVARFAVPPGWALQAYRFALDPTPGQVRALLSHAGAARVAFNFGLALLKANEAQRAAERSYGLAEDQLTPKVDRSAYGLRKAWNAAKHEVAPWWAENSKEAYAAGCANLAAALRNHSDSKHGQRAGRAVGFPRFKSRHRSVPSVRFTTGGIGVDPGRHHVVLPRLGRIKTHESTRKLARRIEAGTARVLSATVRRQGGRWYCSFIVVVQRVERTPRGAATRSSGWTWASGPSPCSPTDHRWRTRATWMGRCGASAAAAAPWPAGSAPSTRPPAGLGCRRTGGAAPSSGSRPRTPGSPTCAATACTS